MRFTVAYFAVCTNVRGEHHQSKVDTIFLNMSKSKEKKHFLKPIVLQNKSSTITQTNIISTCTCIIIYTRMYIV